MKSKPSLEIYPLDATRWNDLETLFNGPGGAQVRGCWCMYYRWSGEPEIPPGMSRSDLLKANADIADQFVSYGIAKVE